MRIVMTGGHHSSALPVLSLVQEQNPDIEVHWFGHKYSHQGDRNPTLEYLEITGMGIPFYNLKAGKFYKTYNLWRLARIPFGFLQALYLLLKIRPSAILSFGGYLAVPTVIAGWLLRIPSLTHEQTVAPGLANVLISRFSRKVLISFRESGKYFSTGKVVYSGLPLRKEVFKQDKKELFEIGLNKSLPTVLMMGGKTGAHKLNQVVLDSLPSLLSICNVIHQCGDNSVFRDFEKLKSKYENLKASLPGVYILKKFISGEEIGSAYAVADLFVGRSGAHTVCEILALRKKSLFIPIPWVSHNEQFENARVAVKAGLGVILAEKDLTASYFVSEVSRILQDRQDINTEVLEEFSYPKIPSPEEVILKELLMLTV